MRMAREKMQEARRIEHPIPPFAEAGARVLILGSFPSVKSRESGFFYGHTQNRFWKVLARVFEDAVPSTVDIVPVTVDEKKAFLAAHGIALWDVIASCTITGSADSSIRDVVANDVGALLRTHDIRAVFTNGKTAQALFDQHLAPSLGVCATCLPSTSPANAAWGIDRLVEAWRVVGEAILL